MFGKQTSKGFLSESSQVVLNVFNAKFDPAELHIWRGKYEESKYKQVARLHPSFGFLRDRRDGNYVYAWSYSSNPSLQEPGFSPITISQGSHPTVLSKILTEGVSRHLQSIGFTRLPSKEFAYKFVNFSVGNLLSEIPELKAEENVLGVFPKINIQSFVTSFEVDRPRIGLIVDVDYAVRLDASIAKLSEIGMDLRDTYIRLRVPSQNNDSELAEYSNQVVGKLKKIEGEEIHLEDLKYAHIYKTPIEWSFIEPNKANFNSYLMNKYGDKYQKLQQKVNDAFAKHISPKRRCTLIEAFVRRRLSTESAHPISICDGLSVWFEQNYPLSSDTAEFKLGTLAKPQFSFDSASDKVLDIADQGLSQYGPYDHEKMAKRKFKLLFIAPDTFRGQVEKFVEQFKSGIQIPSSRFPGFVSKYRLNVETACRFFKPTSIKEANDYQECCRQIVAKQHSDHWDLCFVITKESHKRLPERENPYYLCKNLLLGFDMTVQDLLIETLAKPNNSLQFILNNIGLAVYAKLGGTPFVLKTPSTKHYELIFGIGSSVQKPSRFGAGKRVVGITTLFSRDGDYILSGSTPFTDFDSYERRLKETVEQGIKDAIDIQAIKPADKLRLIFHAFKETGRKETQAIQEAIARFEKFDIEYAIVHVNTDHQFKLFDKLNPGREYDTSIKQYMPDELAAFIPDRGLMVNLGPRDRLINFIGPSQYRKRGCPSPLRITLDRSSTFSDIDYIAQQIYQFAFISWRSFLPSKEPITILYSSLIADLNSRLNELGGWNPERININLRRKMWFL